MTTTVSTPSPPTVGLHKNTPLIHAQHHENILLKLDCLQPSGSFKIRGLGRLAQKAVAQGATHLVSSSGGNAGLAAAYAGKQLGVPVSVFLPTTAPPFIPERLRAYGANVTVIGSVFDETNQHATVFAAENKGCFLVHPFDNPEIWSGHASLVEELKEEMASPPAAIIVSVGGGGLLLGIWEGLKKVGWQDSVHIIAVETEGSASLGKSLQQGRSVTLDGINTIAKSLGAKTLASAVLEQVSESSGMIKSFVVSDAETVKACLHFLDNHYMLTEPACGASLATAYYHEKEIRDLIGGKEGPIVVVACGGSLVSFASLQQWSQQLLTV